MRSKVPVMVEAASNVRELEREVLSLSRLSIQGLSVIGPAITVAILITGIAGVALSATPLVFIIATVAVLINANTAIQFSKHISSAGGYFSYISHGLGPKTGIMGGLYQLFYQVNNVAFLALWNGFYIGTVYSFFTGTGVSAYAMLGIAFLTILFYFTIQYIGIRKAVNFNYVTGLIEAAFLVIVSFIIIAVSGSHNTLAVFLPGPAGLRGVGLGMIFALLSFGGYTTVISLSEEAKKPKETIGIAVIVTVVLAGIIFVISSYALTVGWGANNMAAFAALPLPGFTVVDSKIGIVAAGVLALIVLSSNLNAVNGQMVNISRLVYRMSRDGVFPPWLGKVHARYRSPYTSLLFLTVVSTVVMLVAFYFVQPLITAVFLLATFATVGTIMVHTISNVAMMNYYRKRRFSILLHGILPVIASVLILYALYVSVYPFVFPYYIAPVALLIWTLLSLGFVFVFSRRHADRLRDVGKFTL